MDRIALVFSFVFFCLLFGGSHQQVANIATGKPADQKRDYVGEFTWGADKAVDGCYLRDDPENQGCCSASIPVPPDDTADNYWRLNLTRLYQVERIVIYARTDQEQLDGFTLHTIRTSGDNEVEVPSVTPVDYVYTFTFSPLENVTEIVVRRTSDDNTLTICEVDVIAACLDGFYGTDCLNICSGGCVNNTACDKTNGVCTEGCASGYYGEMCIQCGNCLNNDPCNKTTGICEDGCADGWRGGNCTEACPDGTFGSNCSEVCGQCVDICNFVNGSCSGNCLAGWQGDMCIEACSNGTYGPNCSMPCGNCLNGEQCNHVDGTCPGRCDPGWETNMCNTTCSNNRYGDNCSMTCGQCLEGAQCDHINGECLKGCAPGWETDMCDTVCSGNTYGDNCSMSCGNCYEGDTCNHVNGTCARGCAPGWQEYNCSQVCDASYFGQDCSQICYCANDANCDPITGKCPGQCQPGYQPDTCSKACEDKTFGVDCMSDCGSCINNETCDIMNGTCLNGCSPGWLQHNCTEECSDGYFGDNCVEECGNCLDNGICNFETGSCPSGCGPGWTGPICKTDPDQARQSAASDRSLQDSECNDGSFGENCLSRCYCADKEPCNKTTGLCPDSCEAGYIGEFCHLDTNRAKGRQAYQSSTLYDSGFLWNASLAVDGNNNQISPNESMTCSATAGTEVPWWYVDMDRITVIDSVIVYGRLDIQNQLDEFQLHLSNDTDITGSTPAYELTGDYGDGIFNISLDDTLARYIYVTLPNPATLSICELRVFGECHDGQFGPECESVCHCADQAPCNKTSGLCPNGNCEPGWNPTTCSEPCPWRTYSYNCNETCGYCKDGVDCDKVNGTCYGGCDPGWRTDICTTTCGPVSYGQDCNNACGSCKGDNNCNHINGTCADGCIAGFKGALCLDGCADGEYGENCATSCGNCAGSDVCAKTDGACPGNCAPGFEGLQCASAIKQDPDGSGDTNVGAIVGGVLGGVALLIIIFVVYKLLQKRKTPKESSASYFTSLHRNEGDTLQPKADEGGYAYVNKSYSTNF